MLYRFWWVVGRQHISSPVRMHCFALSGNKGETWQETVAFKVRACLISPCLVAPYCAILREYLSNTPLLRAMGFLASQHGQLGAIPPPAFLSVSTLESVRSGGAIPPPPLKRVPQRYWRDTPWKQGTWVRYPPLRYYLESYCAVWGGISRWAAKSPCDSPNPRQGPSPHSALNHRE